VFERGVHPELGGEERAGCGEVTEGGEKFAALGRGQCLGEFDQGDLELVHGLIDEDSGVEEGVEDVVRDGDAGCGW
jgi:hypothetical protein